MISLLNVARPLAMKALQNPKILGSLLVGSVGAQQANEIQNQLSLGNISLDDVYDTLINFASSPAVSIINEMQTTPAGEVYAPKESDIEAERKFNEELNKQITLPSEIPLDQILSTPETTTKPEPLITPDIPEQKTKVEDVGFTEAAPMPTILTAGIEPKDIDPKDISDKSYEGVQVRVKGPILEQFEDPGKGVYLVRNPDGSLTDLKGKVFENATLKVDPKAFDVRVFNANNEIVGDYNLRDDIVVDDKGRRNYVGEESIYKVNRLGGTKFDLTQSPEGTEIDKTSGKNGVLAVTKGLTTGGQHYYTMGVDFNNPVQLMEYPENPNNPRLLPTSTGEITLGNKVGEIKVKSSDKTHPLYDNIIIGKQIGKDNDSLQDTSEIIGTDSGVVINFADRKARDLEMGDNIENYINYSTYNAESDKTQSEIFGDPKAIEGHGDDPRFLFGFSKKDGSRGYAYGYLTDKNIAFVDQLTAVDGSFSPQEYKEIKDAVQNYTGADKVGGFRVSGARKGAYDKQVTISSDVTSKTVYSPQDSVLKNEIRPVLTKDLLKPQYLKKLKEDDDISCGQCYAASEAAFHMYGKDNGFKSYVLNSKNFPEGLDEGDTHWFLKNKEGEIIDPTAEQFGGITIPYDKGKGTGFLTKNPSNAAQQIIDRVNQNNAQILSGEEFVSNATKIKDKNVKIPDILEFLDKGKKRDIFNEEDYKAMLDEGLQEINYQLQQEVTGEGWYDEGVREAMEIAPKINPKFADNPDLKDLLIFTTAIASSGVNVGSDFKVALQVADIYADTGEIPLTNPKTNLGWTQRGTNLAKQLNLANNYIQENGLPAFLEFLHSEMTGREIQNFRKEYGDLGPSKGVTMDRIYSGHRAFGPKIGEFMANLYGTDDNNVTDMWNIRGMNRLMGNSMYLRDSDGKIMTDKDGKIMENTGSPTKEFKNIFDKYMTDLSNLIGKSVRDTQAIRWYLEQGLYTALGVRSVPKDYGTAAQEVLDQKLKTESDGTIRSSKTSNIKGTPPTKKAQGGSISIPQRRSLVNDGLVDINTIIGKINYGN